MKCPDCKREGAYYRIKKKDIACNKCGLGIVQQHELKQIDDTTASQSEAISKEVID